MSDVYRDFVPIFGKKVPFAEAYPQIENIKVEVEQRGQGVREWNKNWVLNGINDFRQYIDCSNPLCAKGGFALGEMVRDMVRNKDESFEQSKICIGNEGSPKGKRIYRKCMNYFTVKVAIQYKKEVDKENKE